MTQTQTQMAFNTSIRRLLVQCRRNIDARLRAREMELVYVRKYTVQAHFRKTPKRRKVH